MLTTMLFEWRASLLLWSTTPERAESRATEARGSAGPNLREQLSPLGFGPTALPKPDFVNPSAGASHADMVSGPRSPPRSPWTTRNYFVIVRLPVLPVYGFRLPLDPKLSTFVWFGEDRYVVPTKVPVFLLTWAETRTPRASANCDEASRRQNTRRR